MDNEEKRYFALHYICTFFGVPYDFGGESSIGIDCSGLAQEFLRSVGMDPEGFYGSDRDVTHVAICMTPELIIEAGGGGRRTTNEARAHAHKAFVRMRPYDRRTDIVAICDPFKDDPLE
jgi:hypothetical protein